MKRWVSWTLIAVAAALFWWGWFVLGFLGEPSAVDRVRVALILIGGGSLVVGVALSAAAIWMLLVRRTRPSKIDRRVDTPTA